MEHLTKVAQGIQDALYKYVNTKEKIARKRAEDKLAFDETYMELKDYENAIKDLQDEIAEMQRDAKALMEERTDEKCWDSHISDIVSQYRYHFIKKNQDVIEYTIPTTNEIYATISTAQVQNDKFDKWVAYFKERLT